jgi:hypothetical protein
MRRVEDEQKGEKVTEIIMEGEERPAGFVATFDPVTNLVIEEEDIRGRGALTIVGDGAVTLRLEDVSWTISKVIHRGVGPKREGETSE